MEMNLNSNSPLMKWGIVLGSAILYFLLLPLIDDMLGPSAGILVAIPVALATWYFGLAAGLIASFLGVSLSVVFLIWVEGYQLSTLMYFGLILRSVALVLIVLAIYFFRKRIDQFTISETETLSRQEYLELLNDMTRAILLSNDQDAILAILASDMAKLIKADDCYITRWDEHRGLAIPTKTTASLATPYVFNESTANKDSMTASVLKTGHTLAADDVFNSPYLSVEIAKRYPARSVLGVPLIARENKLGAAIIAFNTPHHFTPQEIERAEQAGKHVALALWSAQQDLALQRRLRETNALANISLALSETEKIGHKNVLQLIVESAKELIPNVQQAVIHLIDSEKQELTPEAVTGYDNPIERSRKMRLGEGVAGQVISSGETINIEDVETDPRFIKLDKPPSFRSMLVAPVQSGEKKLGTISVLSSTLSAFSQQDNQLLSALGIQAAIAIDNAYLLESIQQALKEVNALYSVNQSLAASLDPDELFKDTVDLLQKNFGYYHVQVCMVDADSGELVLRAGSGTIGEELKKQGHRLEAGEGIVGYAVETGSPFFTNEVDQVVFFVRNPLLPDTKSELAVPVKVGEQILGVLDVQHVPPHELTQRDIQLVSAVADQLAIALQKAGLYEDLQISLQQEKAIRNQLIQNERLAVMGRLLATVSHELNNPLQAIQNALFLLKEEEQGISQQGRQDLEIVLAESERMSGLIERLRTTYRPAQPQDLQSTQLNNIVEDVLALITTHLRHNEITFDFHPESELPSIPALPDQLRQVVLNLLMNAVEAMPSGGTLTVNTKLLKDSQEILLTITDTGAGIDPAILPNIFDAFVTNKSRGTGLGLTITYDIIAKHRGHITAENNQDKGSTFSVWLPLENREVV